MPLASTCLLLAWLHLLCVRQAKRQMASRHMCLSSTRIVTFSYTQEHDDGSVSTFPCLGCLLHACVQIRSLAPLTSLQADAASTPPLVELYAAANKVTAIEGITGFTALTVLELGSNRIRTIEGLEVGWLRTLQLVELGCWACTAARVYAARCAAASVVGQCRVGCSSM